MSADLCDLTGWTLEASGFDAPAPGVIDVLTDVLITLDQHGLITAVHRPGDLDYQAVRAAAQAAGRFHALPPGRLLLPGFVDCHVHAPQYPQLGKALDVPLEVWLQRYTFPLEARYHDLAFAERAYRLLVDDLLASGTTTALYFATIHQAATRLLVDLCLEKGQRALIGKVVMDHPDSCPDFYRDASVEAALEGTQALIAYIRHHPGNQGGLVWPVITPRFIPACTDDALAGLGALAAAEGCHVQTHCSESDWEHQHVFERLGVSDAEALDQFGLLGRRTMLAHGNFLTLDDFERLRLRAAAVAHCPLSNAYFAGAVFPLRAALAKGVHVGLGTDISGGPSGLMLENCRAAVTLSRLLETGVEPSWSADRRAPGTPARIDFRHAFYLATAGGGQALDLPVGRLASGYRFDALAIDTTAAAGGIRPWPELDTPEELLQKIIFTASRANIETVWVDGRRVAGSSASVPGGS